MLFPSFGIIYIEWIGCWYCDKTHCFCSLILTPFAFPSAPNQDIIIEFGLEDTWKCVFLTSNFGSFITFKCGILKFDNLHNNLHNVNCYFYFIKRKFKGPAPICAQSSFYKDLHFFYNHCSIDFALKWILTSLCFSFGNLIFYFLSRIHSMGFGVQGK